MTAPRYQTAAKRSQPIIYLQLMSEKASEHNPHALKRPSVTRSEGHRFVVIQLLGLSLVQSWSTASRCGRPWPKLAGIDLVKCTGSRVGLFHRRLT